MDKFDNLKPGDNVVLYDHSLGKGYRTREWVLWTVVSERLTGTGHGGFAGYPRYGYRVIEYRFHVTTGFSCNTFFADQTSFFGEVIPKDCAILR